MKRLNAQIAVNRVQIERCSDRKRRKIVAKGKWLGDFLILDADVYWKHIGIRRQPFQLGDWIHHRLHPIVKFSDRYFGTKLSSCSACQQRRRWLNEMLGKLNQMIARLFRRIVPRGTISPNAKKES